MILHQLIYYLEISKIIMRIKRIIKNSSFWKTHQKNNKFADQIYKKLQYNKIQKV